MGLTLQWFPGHVGKARREVRILSGQARVIFHLLDARAPISTFYPELTSKKKTIIVFTKTDLADLNLTQKWKLFFEKKGYPVYLSKKNDSLQGLRNENFWGISSFLGKAIVVGLPNVGKSSFINTLVQRKKTKTGKIPGITRGPQWVKLNDKMYLLDTPGIFYPQNIPQEKAWRLAVLGIAPEKIYIEQVLEVGEFLMRYVRENYSVFQDQSENYLDFLKIFGKTQGILSKGGAVHLENAALRLIHDFQRGKWGRMTLDKPVFI